MIINNVSIKKFKFKSIHYSYLLIAILMYLFEGMYFKEEFSAITRLAFAVSIITVFGVFKKKVNGRNFKLKSIFLFIMISIIAINFMFNGINVDHDIYTILIIILAYILSLLIKKEIFTKGYVLFMAIICLFSSIIFIIDSIIPSLLPNLTTHVWHGEITFRNFFVAVIDVSSNNKRNFGIFFEPGLFGIFANLALYLELFYLKKRKSTVIILLIGVLTSLSTNAYISLLLIGAIYLFNRNNSFISKTNIKKIFVIVFLCLLLTYFFYMNPDKFIFLTDKFKNIDISDVNDMGSGSAYERLRALIYGVELFFENPFVGVGMSNFLKKFENIIATFTPINWFAIYGLFFGLLANISFAVNTINGKGKFVTSLSFLFLFSLIVTQNMFSDIIIWMFIFYGIERFNLTKNYEKIDIQQSRIG